MLIVFNFLSPEKAFFPMVFSLLPFTVTFFSFVQFANAFFPMVTFFHSMREALLLWLPIAPAVVKEANIWQTVINGLNWKF